MAQPDDWRTRREISQFKKVHKQREQTERNNQLYTSLNIAAGIKARRQKQAVTKTSSCRSRVQSDHSQTPRNQNTVKPKKVEVPTAKVDANFNKKLARFASKMELAYNTQGTNVKINSFSQIEDPYMLIQIVKKICSKPIRNEKEYLQTNIYKKDLIEYVKSRYSNISFCKKLI